MRLALLLLATVGWMGSDNHPIDRPAPYWNGPKGSSVEADTVRMPNGQLCLVVMGATGGLYGGSNVAVSCLPGGR